MCIYVPIMSFPVVVEGKIPYINSLSCSLNGSFPVSVVDGIIVNIVACKLFDTNFCSFLVGIVRGQHISAISS